VSEPLSFMSPSIKAHCSTSSSKLPEYHKVTASEVISQPRASRSHTTSEHYHLSPAIKGHPSDSCTLLDDLITKSALKLPSTSSSNEDDLSVLESDKDKWNLDSVFRSPKTESYD